MLLGRWSALVSSGLLVLATAPAALANGGGTVTVNVAITGYAPGGGVVDLSLMCVGLGNPYTFHLGPDATSGSFEYSEVPPGACTVDAQPANPGEHATWGEVQYIPGPSQPIGPGGSIQFDITVQRFYDGSGLDWDVYREVTLDVFTVDRVLLNKTGGITVEGSAWCPDIEGWPTLADPPAFGLAVVGISWDALQYVGRTKTVHGSYDPDIATVCFDSDHPDNVQSWQTRRGAANGAIWWVYGTDGKFGSGTIIVDAAASLDQVSISQYWDVTRPDFDARCSPVENESGFYDSNGDGFCAYSAFIGGRTLPTPLKASPLKGR